MRLLLLAIVLLACGAAYAQQPPAHGCDSPESRQLDFWLGEWELSYQSEGKRERSRNRITKVLDGCAILEEFSGPPGTQLVGRSLSTFDRATRQWKQAWVDNTGAYLDFTGGRVDGDMAFWREAVRDGQAFRQRMVFRDVKADSLRWLWQRSDDNGSTWRTLWEIEYARAGTGRTPP